MSRIADARGTGIPDPSAETLRVLYIGGWGRSGSTVLDLLLGQAPGVFSAGEIREIWQSGLAENRPCGCERPFGDCPFWQQVGAVAFGGWDQVPLAEILRLRYSLDRPWSFPALPLARVVDRIGGRVRIYTGTLERLYHAIAEVSGAGVIVDSSNLPSHAFLLRTIPSIDLRVVHLVRDSRGVAFSWRKEVEKRRASGPSAHLPRYGPGASSIRWIGYNGMTEALRPLGVPYAFARYEDLMHAPREVIRRLLRHAGLAGDAADPTFIHGHRVHLGPNHTVEGNPMRFSSGELELRADEEWRRRMPLRDRRVVTGLTFPLLVAYRYPIDGGEGT